MARPYDKVPGEKTFTGLLKYLLQILHWNSHFGLVMKFKLNICAGNWASIGINWNLYLSQMYKSWRTDQFWTRGEYSWLMFSYEYKEFKSIFHFSNKFYWLYKKYIPNWHRPWHLKEMNYFRVTFHFHSIIQYTDTIKV